MKNILLYNNIIDIGPKFKHPRRREIIGWAEDSDFMGEGINYLEDPSIEFLEFEDEDAWDDFIAYFGESIIDESP